MSNWVYKINFVDLWKAYDEKKLNSTEVGIEIAKRLKKLIPNLKIDDDDIYRLEEIIDEFEYIENTEHFDYVLSTLYDWADMPLPTPRGEMIRKILWIRTF